MGRWNLFIHCKCHNCKSTSPNGFDESWSVGMRRVSNWHRKRRRSIGRAFLAKLFDLYLSCESLGNVSPFAFRGHKVYLVTQTNLHAFDFSQCCVFRSLHWYNSLPFVIWADEYDLLKAQVACGHGLVATVDSYRSQFDHDWRFS